MKDKNKKSPQELSGMTPEEFKSWASKELKKCMEIKSFKIEEQQFSTIHPKKQIEDH